MSQTLGQNQSHYYSQGDQLGRCPQCYGNSISSMGTLSVNGTSHDVQNCTNCNRLFTGANGGIQSLINEAQQQYNTQNVGFITQNQLFQNQLGGYQTAGGMGYQGQPQYTPSDNSYKFDQMNSSLSSMISYLSILQNQMSQLTAEILRIANQNQELMNKLATDPLINIRKRVSDFNLE